MIWAIICLKKKLYSKLNQKKNEYLNAKLISTTYKKWNEWEMERGTGTVRTWMATKFRYFVI